MVIGNVGFLGIFMLLFLFGEVLIGLNMLVLMVDLIVFFLLIVILIIGVWDGWMSFGILCMIGLGLLCNLMIVLIVLGFGWFVMEWLILEVVNMFLDLLGFVVMSGVLFVIGVFLVGKLVECFSVVGWIIFCKLVLYFVVVVICVLMIFKIDVFLVGVIIVVVVLLVVGNVFMLV